MTLSKKPKSFELILTCIMLVFNLINLQSQTKELVLGEQPIYKVSKTKDTFIADGKMD